MSWVFVRSDEYLDSVLLYLIHLCVWINEVERFALTQSRILTCLAHHRDLRPLVCEHVRFVLVIVPLFTILSKIKFCVNQINPLRSQLLLL